MGLYKVIPTMGLNFGDLDNDGWLDFYLGTGNPDLGSLIPNRMFRNAGGRSFQDVTTAGNFGHLQKGHAICFGDFDNDGQLRTSSQRWEGPLSATRRIAPFTATPATPTTGSRWSSRACAPTAARSGRGSR